MEVALAVTTVQEKNDDHYVWISKQGIIFFKIFVYEIRHLFNVTDIVSQLKDKGIPIIVPFCMTNTVLFTNTHTHIYVIKYVLIYSIAFSIVVLKCNNKNLIHMNIVIRYICVNF